MDTNQKATTMDRKVLLSTIWIFAAFNYLYCDIISLMDSELLKQYLTGKVNGMEFTGDSNNYGSPIQGVEVQSQSLGKHHCRCNNDAGSSRISVCRNASHVLRVLQRS